MKMFKTKAATKKAIYNLVAPLIKGFFQDTDWSGVRSVWTALEQEGVTVTIVNTRYREQENKTWWFTLGVNGFHFDGNLIACFCGTVKDPTSRYDICFLI